MVKVSMSELATLSSVGVASSVSLLSNFQRLPYFLCAIRFPQARYESNADWSLLTRITMDKVQDSVSSFGVTN